MARTAIAKRKRRDQSHHHPHQEKHQSRQHAHMQTGNGKEMRQTGIAVSVNQRTADFGLVAGDDRHRNRRFIRRQNIVNPLDDRPAQRRRAVGKPGRRSRTLNRQHFTRNITGAGYAVKKQPAVELIAVGQRRGKRWRNRRHHFHAVADFKPRIPVDHAQPIAPGDRIVFKIVHFSEHDPGTPAVIGVKPVNAAPQVKLAVFSRRRLAGKAKTFQLNVGKTGGCQQQQQNDTADNRTTAEKPQERQQGKRRGSRPQRRFRGQREINADTGGKENRHPQKPTGPFI